MTRGRHRQSVAVTLIAPLTLGAVATAGVTLAVLHGDLQVLRLAVVASWVIALGLGAQTMRRGRAHRRDIALAESVRRREEGVFGEQLSLLQGAVAGLQVQLERLGTESAALRREVVALRADKAEAEEIVRRARAERARAALAEREAQDQRLLTAAAFEAAAAVLAGFEQSTSVDTEPDWVTTWIANLGTAGELDLTMHDDTISLELSAARDVPAMESA